MRLDIRLPASTSNLGPGFDCLGLALKLYNQARLTWEKTDRPLPLGELEPWARSLPYSQRAVALAYAFYAEKKGLALPKVQIDFGGDIPVARGLGSSATCAIAGLAAGQLQERGELDKEELLVLATGLEGHPDNVAPAIFGGLILSKMKGEAVVYAPLACHPSLRIFLFIPDFSLSTKDSRAVLPSQIPHAEAVRQAASLGFLLQGLATGQETFLQEGSEDFLHQAYRQPLIPDYQLIADRALGAGCAAVMLSGAGPALVGLASASREEAQDLLARLEVGLPPGWQVKSLAVDPEGSQFTVTHSP